MSVIHSGIAAICFSDMAKKADQDTEQLNFRLSKPLVKQIRAYCAAHPFRPSFTRLAELAFAEYMRLHPLEPDAEQTARRKT